METTARSREVLWNRLVLVGLWLVFYCSFALWAPPLLDDADSVHAEVAREMLTRHDYVTLYANGIRYLEKAPLFYWLMAISMKLFGATTAASRVPLAGTVCGLVLLLESFGRRAFGSARVGFYAGLITLSSFGIFIFTRINIPDALVCLLLTAALYAFWTTEREGGNTRGAAVVFAVALALNVLTKGLIGIVFPLGIVAIYLLVRRGWRGAWRRVLELHPLHGVLVFFVLAAPWHVLIALANPGHGYPGDLARVGRHWQVPLPTDGNVHGWAWFYFVNEQVYRYLNLRVPHDYDTAPLWLFLGLIFVWLMPWSAYLPQAITRAWRERSDTDLLLLIWAVVPLVFFSLSTRQEYYVLPSLPPLILLVARVLVGSYKSRLQRFGAGRWDDLGLAPQAGMSRADGPGVEALSSGIDGIQPLSVGVVGAGRGGPSGDGELGGGARWGVLFEPATVLLVLGVVLSAAMIVFVLRTATPSASTDLASLLQQNPGDYALSFGHFLDLNGQALGLFRVPLALTAIAFLVGPLANFVLRRRSQPHAATLCLAGSAFLFLFAAHLGLRTFSPTLTSAQLADAVRPQLHSNDMIAIHGEYEAGSTLGFYLRRNDLHIVEGRSSNLWYGSFFPDAPRIFETRESLVQKWAGPQRIFLWQDPQDHERPPLSLSPVFVIARSGGHEVLSNQANR